MRLHAVAQLLRTASFLLFVAPLVACSEREEASPPMREDAGTPDLGPLDLGPPDLGPRDFGPPPDLGPPPGDVHVVITADNAYSFAYGSASAIDTFIRGSRAMLAGEIFSCPVGNGPEEYTVPAASVPTGAYLYIVTWDDLSVTQGVLGEFERDGSFVYTGDERFEVCATGVDYSRAGTGIDPIAGPTEEAVEAEIARCNAASGDAATTSRGWVDLMGPVTPDALGTLAVGEANDSTPDSEFPPVCAGDATTPGIDTAARWMWYAPPGLSGSAFRSTGSNTFRSFLIFRLPADEIILI
jgi:hypothetical protein